MGIGFEGGGGSGGLVGALGPEQNVFGVSTTADKAAASALLTTYAAANAAWLAEYDGNRSFYVLLRWTGGAEQLQRRNVAGTAWEDAVGIVVGPDGAQGVKGDTGSNPVVLTPAYSAANNRITMTGLAAPTSGTLIFALMPANLDRDDTDLTVAAGTIEETLSGMDGTALSARDLTPGVMLPILYLAGSFRVTEHLLARSQDFAIHLMLFEADNAAGVPPNYDDAEHVLTQALVDAATVKTMSGTDSPRVNWPDNFVPSRALGSTGVDVYDDTLAVLMYLAVPDDAPDIRGVGSAAATYRWNGSLGGVRSTRRVAGTFDIGGVAHKFIWRTGYLSPDFTDDPPTDWQDFREDGNYFIVAFQGLPDPVDE